MTVIIPGWVVSARDLLKPQFRPVEVDRSLEWRERLKKDWSKRRFKFPEHCLISRYPFHGEGFSEWMQEADCRPHQREICAPIEQDGFRLFRENYALYEFATAADMVAFKMRWM